MDYGRPSSRGAGGSSVEFVAIEERTLKGGVREIQRALIRGAALVRDPEFDTSVGRAEGQEGVGHGGKRPLLADAGPDAGTGGSSGIVTSRSFERWRRPRR